MNGEGYEGKIGVGVLYEEGMRCECECGMWMQMWMQM